MAYLLSRSGVTSMLIQRAHYGIKKYLAYRHQIQFIWHQAWSKLLSVAGRICRREVLVSKFWSWDGLEMLFWKVSVSSQSWANLVRSRSRSCLEQKTAGLGLVLVSGLNVSFYKLVLNGRGLLKLVLAIILSVGLNSTTCRLRNLFFSCHQLLKFMYYQAFALFCLVL